MNLGRPRSGWRQATARPAAALALLASLVAGPMSGLAQEFTSNAGWRDVTVAEYQQHLKNLDATVAACQSQRSAAGVAQTTFPACDPAQIGPDNRVRDFGAAPSQFRELGYDWLRSVLARATKKNDAAQKTSSAQFPDPTTSPSRLIRCWLPRASASRTTQRRQVRLLRLPQTSATSENL